MQNFVFQNPVKLIFGKGTIASLGKEIPAEAKIMITFGGGSVKSNGVYAQVVEALKGRDFVEFWGIEPNPTVESVRKAVELGRKNGVDFLLSVGGGSVADGTKLIAAAMISNKDPWDIVLSGYCDKHIPMGIVLTLPATGSEMNFNSVISRDETKEKFAWCGVFAQFSVLDPETTYSLPKHQVACGLADTFVHVMEQYMTTCGQSELMDRWAEGILSTIIEIAPKIAADQHNYDNMANFMLCATMGLNGFVAMGVEQDWTTHGIGHELTALTGLTHGHTLTIVFPRVLDVLREKKAGKILQYGARVWGIDKGSETERINATIAKTEEFFRSLGLKTRLGENGVGDDVPAEVVKRFKERGTLLGETRADHKIVEEILKRAK